MDEYRCWHACLERSNRKKWSEKVEQAFGPGHGLPFEEWWQAVLHLFERPDKLLIHVIDSAEEFTKWTVGDEDEVVVLINLLSPKNELLSALEALLDERHKGTRGRPAKDDWADWPLTGHPNVQAINKALEVYDLHKQGVRPLWRIGVDAKVNLNQIPKRGDPDSDQKRVLAVTVSRYLKRANELIRGVERGVFPA